jgi:hypothetical protein
MRRSEATRKTFASWTGRRSARCYPNRTSPPGFEPRPASIPRCGGASVRCSVRCREQPRASPRLRRWSPSMTRGASMRLVTTPGPPPQPVGWLSARRSVETSSRRPWMVRCGIGWSQNAVGQTTGLPNFWGPCGFPLWSGSAAFPAEIVPRSLGEPIEEEPAG